MVSAQVTRQTVHPILRNADARESSRYGSPTAGSRLSSDISSSPQSQVRFSIPHGPQPESPSKIVFPKSSEEESAYESANDGVADGIRSLGKRGHFMDMHSRVMVDVPEEVWGFHTRKRLAARRSRPGSVGSGDDASRSLQSIIVQTLDSMGGHNADSSTASQVSPLNLRREPKSELYLTTYSPLNSYNVPIPLEISLPPFLSPENKRKKRGSLIFDGKNYSPFDEDPYEASGEEDEDAAVARGQPADTEDELSLSSDSIPSAVHDISFDVGSAYDVDQELGIDQDANVNLKVQRKNLRKQSPQRRQAAQGRRAQPPAARGSSQAGSTDQTPEHPERARGAAVPQGAGSSPSEKSLHILETPVKQICIPDLEHAPLSNASTASLKFFDTFEEPDPPTHSSPTRQADHLDVDFKFPLPSPPDENFTKIDNSPTTASFERRRNRLLQQKSLTPEGRGHMHSRSRSLHGVEDIFAATSTPPSRESEKSPLRQPQEPPSQNDGQHEPLPASDPTTPNSFHRNLAEQGVPAPALNYAHYPASVSPLAKHAPGEFSTPAAFEEHAYEVGITPESETCPDDEYESNASSVYEDVHVPQGDKSLDLIKPNLTQDVATSQDHSTRNQTDASVEIISERILADDHFDFSEELETDDMVLSTPVKLVRSPSPSDQNRPMTSIQSFNHPVIPPKSDYEHIKIHYNPLSPRRSLSNLGSQSSKNSEFSKQTNQSSRTSYPVEREVVNPLVNKLKNSDYLDRSKYPSVPESNEPRKRGFNFPHSYEDDSISSLRRKDNTEAFSKQLNLNPEEGVAAKSFDSTETTSRTEDGTGDEARPEEARSLQHSQEEHYRDYFNSPPTPKVPQDCLRTPASHAPSGSTELYGPDDLYGPQNYQMIEDYQSIRQHLENTDDYVPNGDASDAVGSYLHKLAASEDFREVFETLDRMSPSPQKSRGPIPRKSNHPLAETRAAPRKSTAVDEDYHTEYEMRDGNLVEVLVLDDDSIDSIPPVGGKNLPRTSTRQSAQSRSHENILKMCEDTAGNAKTVILELLNKQEKKKVYVQKRLSRPPPPTSKDLRSMAHSPTRQPGHNSTASRNSQERYLRNLNRAMRPRPLG